MAAVTTKYVFDLQPGDVYWCTADCGWITGHTYLTYGPLLCGAQCVVFEGVPSYPSPARSWQVVEKYKVSQHRQTCEGEPVQHNGMRISSVKWHRCQGACVLLPLLCPRLAGVSEVAHEPASDKAEALFHAEVCIVEHVWVWLLLMTPSGSR